MMLRLGINFTLKIALLVLFFSSSFYTSGEDTNRISKMHDSSLAQQISIFESIAADHPQQAIQNLLQQLSTEPDDDPWICLCYYQMGCVTFENIHNYSSAVDYFDRSLKYPETTYGNHLSALQMKMLSLKHLRRFQEAANVAHIIIETSGPDQLRRPIVPNAAYLEAQLREWADNGDGKQRALAEIMYENALTDTNITSLENGSESFKLEEGSLRERVQNLLALHQTNNAAAVCQRFLDRNPQSYYAPLIALDLKRIQAGRIPLTVNELVDIASKYNLHSGAGAHVLYELAAAKAREGNQRGAIDNAQELISLKLSETDPMPLDTSLLSAAIDIRTTAYLRLGLTNDALRSAAELNSNYIHQIEMEIAGNTSARNEAGAAKTLAPAVHSAVLVRVFIVLFTSCSFLFLIVMAKKSWKS